MTSLASVLGSILLSFFITDIDATRETRFLTDSTDTYHWGEWSSWTVCHVDCDKLDGQNYTQTRSRKCFNPIGGRETTSHCTTSHLTTRYRQSRDCPTDQCPKWSTWSTWSDCNLSCGNGSSIRVRHCDSGVNCKGDPFQTKTCILQQCIQDGGWGSWREWTACTGSCGGNRVRTRLCDNPPPRDGGKPCVGDAIGTETCNTHACSVDGGWSEYKERPCSVTCGTGVAVKVRTCTNPAPAFGGKNCTGSALQFAACTSQDCIIDGGWSDWSNWTDCGVVCGTGHVFRSRTCTSPSPQNGGADCVGTDLDSKDCDNGACPLDIKSCLTTDIQNLVNVQPLDTNMTALPPVCPKSNPRQAELLIQKYCSVTSTEIDWELGIQLFHNCEKIPLYSPLGLINRQTKHKHYGILLDCYMEYIQVADLSCSETLQIHNYQLNHTETDFHMLIV